MHGIARPIVGIFLLWLAAGAAQSAERLYLWEVKDSAASVYLFGSVHLCRADCFPLPGDVLAAFNRAEYLAVELDPTRPGVQEALLRQSLYSEGDSLERHISPELARNLRQATARLGIPSEALLRMKPWMAGTTLTVVGALRAGYKADDGIDLWFLQRARSAPKTVVELESAQQQASALEGLAPDVQESILVQAVALVLDDSLGGYLDGLLAAWRGGDSDGLYRRSQVGMEDGAAAQAMLDAMLVERNRAMTQRIVRLMATGRPGFVVVGALHLAGEQSIVEMLRSRGYEVRQVESP